MKAHLWKSLDAIATDVDDPWLLAGDFNTILDSEERKGGSGTSYLGNMFARKMRTMRELKRVQKALEQRNSIRLGSREAKLRLEVETILSQEELLWFQKSRSEWFSSGDWNTRFFHSQTLKPRKQNKIVTLRMDDS
ncbi:hypothetical protein PVK06_011886 [Gossypium arboreum]|uniref:Uncharacterized protein n=1 Tax=Gossypium arboreum TaxID=29729 RepID=A0ABR0QAQ0_GOSAR|nr:hypothetical protein PVK06_011886 [Gossypium arboreum]